MRSRQSEAGHGKLEVWIILNHSVHTYQTRHGEANQGMTNGGTCPAVPTLEPRASRTSAASSRKIYARPQVLH